MLVEKLWKIAYDSFVGFFDNRLSTSAAAMAFYTMFALGPIMIFSIAIAEPFVGKILATQAIFDALGTVVDPEHLKTIQRFASEGPVPWPAASPRSAACWCCSIPAAASSSSSTTVSTRSGAARIRASCMSCWRRSSRARWRS